MIRSLLIEELTKKFGQSANHSGMYWWTAYVGTGRPVHICLNQKIGKTDVAHVLVFHPDRAGERRVTEMRLITLQDATEALQQINRIVEAHVPREGGMESWGGLPDQSGLNPHRLRAGRRPGSRRPVCARFASTLQTL